LTIEFFIKVVDKSVDNLIF